jgi:hypothetical protein
VFWSDYEVGLDTLFNRSQVMVGSGGGMLTSGPAPPCLVGHGHIVVHHPQALRHRVP